ncbi:MSCRAMM family protein [Bifidobacterium vansinderenii]|uniref:LPXTG-domain-containing protein cell wall anchor domain n=1 Tax=Bifidobacterium vansinderenii TaxID=1984871 RepID=A0A229VXR0_9BIFI|nr:SpaA isopeptide-forming pilin-related protein [Bifidobacterium vansinderenii]OXN00414.1 LPXTG-domain-containing protein cell wall anchor domain [Bifidobacterium vansinderenii]
MSRLVGAARGRGSWLVAAFLALVVAVGLGTVLAAGASSAAAPVDGSGFVESLQAQYLPDGKKGSEGDWVDLTEDAHSITVYEGVRFNVGFKIPKGTLTEGNPVVRIPVKGMRFHFDGGGSASVPSSGSVYHGADKWASFDFNGYDVASKTEYLTLTFTDSAVSENAQTDLVDGHVWFNAQTDAVFPTGADQSVQFGDGATQAITVKRPSVKIEKSALTTQGYPKQDTSRNRNQFQWQVKVTNTSDVPLKNAYLADCRIQSIDAKVDYSTTGLFDCPRSGTSTWDALDQSGFFGGNWGNAFTLYANQSMTVTVTTSTDSTELANNVENLYNAAVLYDSMGWTTGDGAAQNWQTYSNGYQHVAYAYAARAEQPNPFYGKKDQLKIQKAQDTHDTRYVDRQTGRECAYGDRNCSVQISWDVTVTNEGDGPAQAGWGITEEGIGTWFTIKQTQEIVDAVKKASGLNDVTWTTKCTNAYGNAYNKRDDSYPTEGAKECGSMDYDTGQTVYPNLIDHGQVTVNDALPAGASFMFKYYTTAGAEEGDPMVGGRNCATTTGSDGTRLDSKCIGVDYDVESLKKNAVTGSGYVDSNGQYQSEFEWHIGWSLSGSSGDAGKTLVLHETLPEGVSDVIVQYTNPDEYKDGAVTADTFDWNKTYDVFALRPNGLVTIGSFSDMEKVGDQTVNTSGSSAKLVRTGERTFDIIIDKAARKGYLAIAPTAIDPAYVAANGKPSTNAQGRYCATVPVENTVTSNIAASVDDAVAGKYLDGAYTHTAKSGEKNYTVCTVSKKSGGYGNASENGTDSTYTINYNSMGFQLNGGKPVTITDKLTNLPANAAVALLGLDQPTDYSGNGGVTITTYAAMGGGSGSWQELCGSGVRDAQGNQSIPKRCSDYVDWDSATGTIKFKNIPDGRYVLIQYRYRFNSPDSSIPGLRNEFKTDSTTQATGVTDGSTTNDLTIIHAAGTIDARSVKVLKTDAGGYTKLKGAVFRVDKYDGTKWNEDTKNKDLTTGSDGYAVIGQIDCGVAYRVTETTAPDGYALSNVPNYFYMKCADGTTTAIPDDFREVGGNAVIAGSVIQVRDVERPLATLTIVKADGTTMDQCDSMRCPNPLKGTEWDLTPTDENGTATGKTTHIVDNGASDGDPQEGWISVAKLEYGWYKLVETKAPTGYILDSTPVVFQMARDSYGFDGITIKSASDSASVHYFYGSASLLVGNYTTPPAPKPSITWSKIGSDTGTVLENSEWELRDSTGKPMTVVDNGANDEDDRAGYLKVSSGITNGSTYYLTETKAPNGYKLSTATHTITITDDAKVTITGADAAKGNAITNIPEGQNPGLSELAQTGSIITLIILAAVSIATLITVRAMKALDTSNTTTSSSTK